MSIVLEINNVSKSYGRVQAVNDFSLIVEQGSVYGILGPNGSGKTTTLSIILGAIKQDQGHFLWFGQPRDHTVNQRIGALLETPNFYPYLSILQNLKIIAHIRHLDVKNEAEFNRVLTVTDLIGRKNSAFFSLSFGMKQRVALAALLLGDPEVLILDEPNNGLDPLGINKVREIIKAEAERGKTIIMASHILDEVEKVCTHVAILKMGKKLAEGRASELLLSDDTIIIACEKIEGLNKLLSSSNLVKTLQKKNNELFLTLHPTFNSTDINEFAFKNGFVLSKLEVKKKTLEEHFLDVVNK